MIIIITGDPALAVAGPRACNRSSSRSAPIPDIFYFQNTPEVTSVQHILPFSLTVSITDYFLYTALEAACAAYASLNLSLLHYIDNTTNRNTHYLSSLSIAKSNQSRSLLMMRTNNG